MFSLFSARAGVIGADRRSAGIGRRRASGAHDECKTFVIKANLKAKMRLSSVFAGPDKPARGDVRR